MKYIKTALIILFSWGIATIIHELGHIIIARCFGFVATIESIGFNAASVIIHGVMTPFELTAIATAGSAFLILIGAILIVLKIQTIGIVFVFRSWIDMIPINGSDGFLIADSSGYLIAVVLLLIEIMVCSVILFYTRKSFFYANQNWSIDRLLSFLIVIGVIFISSFLYYQGIYSLASVYVNIYYYIVDVIPIHFSFCRFLSLPKHISIGILRHINTLVIFNNHDLTSCITHALI